MHIDMTDEELRGYTADPCQDEMCPSCRVGLELRRRRPDADERAQLADFMAESVLDEYPAVRAFLERQIARVS